MAVLETFQKKKKTVIIIGTILVILLGGALIVGQAADFGGKETIPPSVVAAVTRTTQPVAPTIMPPTATPTDTVRATRPIAATPTFTASATKPPSPTATPRPPTPTSSPSPTPRPPTVRATQPVAPTAAIPRPPVITEPLENSELPGEDLTVSGTAEPDTTVQVYEGDVVWGEATVDKAGNWSLRPTKPLAAGEHSIVAVDVTTGTNSAPVTFKLIGALLPITGSQTP